MFVIENPILSRSCTLTKPNSSPSRSKSRNASSPRPAMCNPQTAFRPRSSDPLWTVAEIAEAVSGRIVNNCPAGTISIDTRTLKPNQWLFAISGKNFDGHDFVTPELARRGCNGVIGNRVCSDWDKGFVEVTGNTTEALIALACQARKRFSGEVIAVCGSVGKTTTRSMIALALGALGDGVYQTEANYNSRIGVALTLIGIPKNAEFAVVEIGISRVGEMLEKVKMASPGVRVMVNVAPSHLGNFGSLEAIATEKGRLLTEAKPGDVCVLNADDPLVMGLPVPDGVKKVLFGKRVGSDVRLVKAESIDDGFAFQVVLEKHEERVDFVIPCPGVHLALNACAATAVATHYGISLTQIGNRLSTFSPVHRRAEVLVAKNGMKIVNDVYNASPLNMKANIDMLNGLRCQGKRVVALGDMISTGIDEIKIHEAVIRQCCDLGIGLVGLFGPRFLVAARNMGLEGDERFILSNNATILGEEILERIGCDDVVLVKGARLMRMEKVVLALMGGIEKRSWS